LQESLNSGDSHAVESFLKDLAAVGAPLVEALADEPARALLTFVVEAADVAGVAVVGGPGGIGFNALHRFSGTPLWYRTYNVGTDARFAYQILENPPELPEDPTKVMAVMMETFSRVRPDSLNEHVFRIPKGDTSPVPMDLVWSVAELKEAPPQRFVDPIPGQPAGKVEVHSFSSNLAGNERRLWVYTPFGYQKAPGEYPWMITFDGGWMVNGLGLPTTLDNMIAEGAIPPVVAVMVEHPGPGMMGRMQELTCSGEFVKVVADEIAPWLRERYAVSGDPRRAIVAGASFGGLAATFVALRRPDIFGNLVCNSGSFWWSTPGDEPEWLAREVADSESAPSNCYLDAGRFEIGSSFPGVPDLLTTVRHMRDILRAKGGQVHYSEHNGGHDFVCMRGQMAEGLIAIAGQWKKEDSKEGA